MQIILLEKVAKVGDLGSVVKVKDGFARNYLIPQGKAKRATEANLKEFEARRAELEAVASDLLTKSQQRAEALTGYLLQLTAKAGVDGRLFGSITNSDIAEGLRAQGFEVQKAEVRMPNGPIKHTGEFPVHLHLHTDVNCEIKVAVLGEA